MSRCLSTRACINHMVINTGTCCSDQRLSKATIETGVCLAVWHTVCIRSVLFIMASKVDVDVAVPDEFQARAQRLRVGGVVHLTRHSDGGVSCSAHPLPPAPAQTPAPSSSHQQQPLDNEGTAQAASSAAHAAEDEAANTGDAAFGTINAEAGAMLPPGAAAGTIRSIRRATTASSLPRSEPCTRLVVATTRCCAGLCQTSLLSQADYALRRRRRPSGEAPVKYTLERSAAR